MDKYALERTREAPLNGASQLIQIPGGTWYGPYAVVAGITLLGALLRIWHLGYKPFWLDEAVLYWISRGSLGEVIAENTARNSAPPLYALLLNPILNIGESEAVLRSVSCLAGILAIPAVYLLARQFLSSRPAYFCTLVVAVAPSQVEYSQQLREYSIVFLLSILLLGVFYRFLRDPSWRNCLVFTFLCLVSLFTQYGLALLILALNVILVVTLATRVDRKTMLTRWTVSQLILLCAMFVVYHVSLKYQLVAGGRGGGSYLASAYWNGTFKGLLRLALINTARILKFTFPGPLPFLVFFGTGLVYAARHRDGRIALMMFAIPMFITFAAACGRLYPYRGNRQDIFLTVMIYILLGFGFEYLLSRANRIFVLALTVVFLFYGLRDTARYLEKPEKYEDIRPVCRTLARLVEPGDRIYVYGFAPPAFSYYYRNCDNEIIRGRDTGKHDQFEQQLDGVLSQEGRLWLVFSHLSGEERRSVLKHVRRWREVKRIAEAEGAWLYVAH